MYISQYKLKCFVYLFPNRSSIFSAVNKHRFRCTFEHTALRCNMESSNASQNSKGIRWIIFSITLNQNSPRTKLLSANVFNGRFLFLIMGILDCLLFHRFAKIINIFIRDIKTSAQSLIIVAVAALKQQFFYHILVSRTCGSSNTNIDTYFSTKRFNIIRTLSTFGNIYNNNCLAFNRL